MLCLALWGGVLVGDDKPGEIVPPGLDPEARRSLDRRLVAAGPDGAFSARGWKRIARAVGDARVLYLGEPNHGSREVFALRTRLVREMHERLGFDVILLEAGFGEVATAMARTEPSAAGLNGAMFGGWRTSEMRELFAYALEQGLSLDGFDVQRTGGGFRAWLDAFLAGDGATGAVGADLEQRYGQAYLKLRDFKAPVTGFAADVEQLIRDYEELARRIETARGDDPTDARPAEASIQHHREYILRTLENRAEFLRYMLAFRRDNDWNKRWAARDRMMAENVAWLAEQIYPGRKIIVIGHNFHIARHNEREEVMGEYLEGLLDRSSYVLGAYSGRGEFADNSGKPEPLSPPDEQRLDIKHVILGMEAPIGFLDFPPQPHRRWAWLDREIAVHDSFIDLSRGDSMILRKHFDGLLLIKDSSVPQP
ncbi:hypothetical protein ABI59_05800 [Acidobacteria bacterium Mor1]|nr:hypothetical protein ABI59_05800 [Acidobacteria bacterium Mor1]